MYQTTDRIPLPKQHFGRKYSNQSTFVVSPYAHGYFYSVVFYMQKPCQTRIMKAVSSQEVIARPPPIRWQMPLVIRHGREDAELGAKVSVDGHDGCHVAAPVAVVGCGPYGYY
jgi:hypothetical protein